MSENDDRLRWVLLEEAKNVNVHELWKDEDIREELQFRYAKLSPTEIDPMINPSDLLLLLEDDVTGSLQMPFIN